MTLDLLGEIVNCYRQSSRMSQEALAEQCELSKTTISRVEKGIPVRKRTLERVVRVLRRPVFLCIVDFEAASHEVVKAELIGKLLSALRHGRWQHFSVLLEEYRDAGVPQNDISLQYEGFFMAMEALRGEDGGGAAEQILFEALSLTVDTDSLTAKMRDIDADLNIGRREARRRQAAALAGSLSPGILETEMLILNAIAVCKYEDGDFDSAECVLRALIYSLENDGCITVSSSFCLPTLYYNLALCYFCRGDRDTVIKLVDNIKKTDDIFEDDCLLFKAAKLEELCQSGAPEEQTPAPLAAFFRPGDFWPTLFSAKILEENFIKGLKKSYSAPIKRM